MHFGSVFYGGWTLGDSGPIRLLGICLMGVAIGFLMSLFAVREESRMNYWLVGIAAFLGVLSCVNGNYYAALAVSLEGEWKLQDAIYNLPSFFKVAFCCNPIRCLLAAGGAAWGFARKIPSLDTAVNRN